MSGWKKRGVFLNNAIQIRNGAANINLIPVANTGGIVSAAIRIASHVVPQVSETIINNIYTFNLCMILPLSNKVNVIILLGVSIIILTVFDTSAGSTHS